MKTRFAKLVPFLCVLCLAFWTPPPLAAQSRPSLGLTFASGHATLSITGSVGSAYTVQYSTSLSRSSSWLTLTNLTLTGSPLALPDPAASRVGNRFYRLLSQGSTNSSPPALVSIEPGTFTMGSPPDEPDRDTNEGPQTVVTISEGFQIGKFAVSQAEYLAVVGTNPSYFTAANGFSSDLTRPVEMVSWEDATNYCALRTQQEQASGKIDTGHAYRLPTEAEWEYACRAGTTTSFFYGADPNYTNLPNYAWFGAYSGGNSGGMTHPAGQKLPNPWGLYDMAGNVEEWCLDWYGPYSGEAVSDPSGATSGAYRVVRGGGWGSPGGGCRSAWRGNSAAPTDTDFSVGFRVVLAPSQ